MVTQAYRLSEAGLIAPFEYVGMPMAILWGAIVFGTWPDAHRLDGDCADLRVGPLCALARDGGRNGARMTA